MSNDMSKWIETWKDGVQERLSTLKSERPDPTAPARVLVIATDLNNAVWLDLGTTRDERKLAHIAVDVMCDALGLGPAAPDRETPELRFHRRWDADDVAHMTAESYARWVDVLPRDEFLAMIGMVAEIKQ